MEWKKIPKSLPPFDTHILGIDERGFIVQTRRFKKWDRHWVGENGEKPKWQYWCGLPETPEDTRRSYDEQT